VTGALKKQDAPAVTGADTSPMLTLRGVSKSFGDKCVLADVNLSVAAGETVSIIGPSGSGKTTLLRTINHLHPPTTGQVILSGRTIGYVNGPNGQLRPASERELARQRRAIGFVFQRFNLFPHLTALQNVSIGLTKVAGMSREAAHERAAAELRKVFLADHMSKRPQELSGGQQQRVAIARALALDPLIILFDEPTSALDPELVREVLDVIRTLAADRKTLMIVTHEMRFAQEVAQRVIFMDEGSIVEQGPPAALFGDPREPRTRKFLSHFNVAR
jgi:polar amino acid transport system ATP-binding protein